LILSRSDLETGARVRREGMRQKARINMAAMPFQHALGMMRQSGRKASAELDRQI
jgi:hypothetical protein